MHNSTHIGPNQNAAVINSWWIFSTYQDQNGGTHHAAHNSMYVWGVLLMIMMAMALLIAFCWLCKGPIFKGYAKSLKGFANTQVGQQQGVIEHGALQQGVIQQGAFKMHFHTKLLSNYQDLWHNNKGKFQHSLE